MNFVIKDLHKLITILKNEENLTDNGVILLEGYAVHLESKLRNCEPPLTKCHNCGEYVRMISTGEFCPNCKC